MKKRAILSVSFCCVLILATGQRMVSKVNGQTESPEKQTEQSQISQTSAEIPKTLPLSFYSHFKGQKVSLDIHDIISLPGGEVFLGGSYSNGADTLHSVLLVSRDGGHTWEDTEIKFGACGIMYFRTVGLSHVWAISTMRQEGCRGPETLLYSSDAGKNWSSVPMHFETMGGLEWIHQFEFFDEQHGLLIMTDGEGTYWVHTTFDGGKNWNKLMASPNDMLQDIEPTCPSDCTQKLKEATLWKKQTPHDYYKISGWIRVRDDPHYIVLESQGVDRKGWKQISQIPGYCKVEKDRIVPIESIETATAKKGE